ncbi:MAG TPA: DUF1207 domain-containing protein [Terriglobia bacterium]|nr:DUF1207 domain-containing protein [Terriglobia bacterium]
MRKTQQGSVAWLPMIVLASLLCTGAARAQDETSQDSGIDNFPATQEIFRPPMADQTEPADRVRYGGSELDFGLALPLQVYTAVGSSSSWQIGFIGGIAAGFASSKTTLQLKATDFHAGIPFAYRKGKWSTRVQFYHISSHLGADYAGNIQQPPFHYSREVLQDLVSYDFSKHFRIYGGPRLLVRTFPHVGRWTFQAGSEWFPLAFASPRFHFYLADDFQTREEVAWQTNISIEPGVQFTTHKGQPIARAEAWFYSGQEPFGQLYYRRERVIGAQFIFTLGPEIKSLITHKH